MNRKKLKTLAKAMLAFAVLAGITGTVSAATINVPDDYEKIQWAIDNATDGDTIEVAAGTYTGTVNISNMNDIEIIGTQKDEVILEPESTLDWDVGGYGSDRQAAIRVVDSTEVVIQQVTLDLNKVKGNQVMGILFWDSEGKMENNVVKNNQLDDSDGGYYEHGAYVRAVDYTHSDRAEVTVSNNEFIDVGRIGLNVHDYVDITISENEFYKTENDFGYGIELGSESIGEITDNTLYGFDTEAESDGSASAGIYIENCFTNDVSDGFTKPVLVEDNEVYDSQHGIHIGNEIDGYAGPVEIDVTLRSNYIHDNLEEGIIIADEDAEDGSSVTVTSQNNVIENNGEAGYFIYTNGDGDITTELSNDAIKNNDYGITLNDTATDSTSVYDISVNNNNIDGNSIYGVNNTIESETIDATLNWWGDLSGSSGEGPGSGDAVSANVDYEPWLGANGVAVEFLNTKSDTGLSGEVEVDASAETDTSVSVTGASDLDVTTGLFSGNPTDSYLPEINIGKYIDVRIDSGAADSMEVKLHYDGSEIAGINEGKLKMYWWNGDEWRQCSDTGVDTSNNYIYATVDDTTSPSLSQMGGTAFSGSGTEETQPTGGEVAPVNKIGMLMPYIVGIVLALIGGVGVYTARKQMK